MDYCFAFSFAFILDVSVIRFFLWLRIRSFFVSAYLPYLTGPASQKSLKTQRGTAQAIWIDSEPLLVKFDSRFPPKPSVDPLAARSSMHAWGGMLSISASFLGRGLCIVHRVPRQGIFWGQPSEHSWVSSLGSSKSCYFLVLEDLSSQQVFFEFVAE